MPTGKKRKYKRVVFLGIAVVCLGLSLLVLFFPLAEAPPIEFETSENTGSVIQLAPGSSLKRELAPGAQEVIGVWVGQGRFLRFSIEKGDLALTTVLYGPTETKLMEHVSQEFEMVEISFPADVAGLYKIELRSREHGETRRPFELKVYPSTSVTAVNRKDSEARQAMANAEVLRASWTKASLLQAIDRYDKAARTWTSVSDFSNASMATIKAGDVCFRLSQYPEALKHFQNAVKLSSPTGDRISTARALSRIGHLYTYTGENDLAQETLNKALALLESRQSNPTSIASHAYAEALSNMAEVIYAKGNLLKAHKHFEDARKMLPEDRKGRARIHLFAGYIAGTTGQPEKALSEISQALALYQETDDKAGEGLALIALGLSYSDKRTEEKATKLPREAIKLFQSIGDRHSEALAFSGIGQASEHRGDHLTALENYEKAFSLFENIGALDFAIAALYKIGTIHRLKKDLDQALTYYQRSLNLSRTAKKVRLEALVLEEIALVYDAQGRSEEAGKQYRTVLKFYETTGDERGQAVALNNYGDFLLRRDQGQWALELFHRALPLSEKIGDTGTFLTTLYNLARAHFKLGAFEEAFSRIKQSINMIEELRENVGSPDARAIYFAVVRRHYELWTDALMQLHRVRPNEGLDAQAFLVSDQSRARSLIDLRSEPRGLLREGAAADLSERERELRGLIRVQAQYQMQLLLNRKNTTEVAEVANETAELRAEYQQIQAELREQNPKLFSLRPFESTSLEQIQNELRDSDAMLLQYALGDARSYLWAITADSLQTYELAGRKSIEDAARELYSLLTARQAPLETIKGDYHAFVEAADNALPEKASKLSQMLLAPVAHQLRNRKLIIVTEGALQAIPFEALPAPHVQLVGPTNWATYVDSLLINTNEISSSPSISTLMAIRSEKNRPGSPNKTVAVIADPVFSRNDDRVRLAPTTSIVADAAPDKRVIGLPDRGLPGVAHGNAPARLSYSSAEADAISAAAPRGTTMIAKGFAASRETVMSSRVGEYQILHFATHGFLDIERPEFSGIVLTMVDRKGVSQNGLMPLHDIYSLDLSVELTVLSACQTALGKDISGEGFLGLPHSFMSAGSKSVVASLWKVDDQATANLMTDFYESLLQQGMPTGAALREAKLKLMKEKQWRAPYFWAGFVLQGEYANRIAIEDNWWPHPAWMFLALLVLLSSGVIVFRKRRRRLFRLFSANSASPRPLR